jgi:hypothetical protein
MKSNALLWMALTLFPATALLPATVAAEVPAAAAPGTAANPEAVALGRQIVDAAFPPATRQAMLEQMMNAMLDQMKAGMPLEEISDPGLRQILLDHLASVPKLLRPTTTAFLPKQMDAVAQAYARMFSVAELKDIAAFSRTSSGKSFLARNSEVMSDPAVAAVNAEYFREVQAVNARVTPELSRKMEAYVKAHPQAIAGPAPAEEPEDLP